MDPFNVMTTRGKMVFVHSLQETKGKSVQRSASIESGHKVGKLPEKREDLVSGFKLWLLQMKGLITKRIIQTKRNWMMYLLMVNVDT